MGEFFDRRLEIYEEHQLTAIASAGEFYPFTARCLPREPERRCWTWAAARGWSWITTFPSTPPPG